MGNLSNIAPQDPDSPGRVRQLIVSPDHAGQRLDNFLLRELKGLPKSRVYRLVRKGQVRVNLGRVKAGYRLRSGDKVRIPPVRLGTPRAPAASGYPDSGETLFEDAHLLILDKPSGVPVHKGTGIRAGIIEALRSRRPELPFLELVHRLDRDTSGCLILAKSRAALIAMHASLRRDGGEPGIAKHYLALVKGELGKRPLRVRTGLRKNARQGGERMVVVCDQGGEAETVFRAQRRGMGWSRVDIELITGRTHQARVHAAHAGHPIAGDRKYGDRDFNKLMRGAGVKRLALHARSLEFVHPVTGRKIRVEAPVPEIFDAVLEGLPG